MGNRSNINLVGNTTEGQNVGSGDGVYKGKNVGNTLQYKTLSVTGTTMVISTDDDNIYFSANTGGGGGGTITGAANGLSLTGGGSEVALGGTLTGNTLLNVNNTNPIRICATGGDDLLFCVGQSIYGCYNSGSNIGSRFCMDQQSRTTLGYCLSTNFYGFENCSASCTQFKRFAGVNDCSYVQLDSGGLSLFSTDAITINGLTGKTSETAVLYINDAGQITSGASGGGGSSSGFTISNNGLCDNGTTTVGLGGTLANDTDISGDDYTHSLSMSPLNFTLSGGSNINLCTYFGSSTIGVLAESGVVNICGCLSSMIVGANGFSGNGIFGDGLKVELSGGSHSLGMSNSGTYLRNLDAKTSETNVVYIDATGKLASGATSGGASYWDRVGTCIIPATADDDVRLDCNAYITWSGTTTCVTAFNSSGTPGADYFCIKRGVTCISSGPTDQVTVYTQGYLNLRSSSAAVALYPSGSIITQCNHQNMCFLGGPSADGTKAGDACICGGQSSSTGNGGTVYLKGGTSVGGADGIICIVGATTATNDITATDFVLSSDESLKTNICSYSPTQLDVNYVQYEFCNKPGCPRYGVIAQELKTSVPEVVRCDCDGIMSVSYIDLLVREVASLKCRVCELEKRL